MVNNAEPDLDILALKIFLNFTNSDFSYLRVKINAFV